MHTDYLSPAIRQLRDQQVLFATCEKQIQQADSAEKLLNELDPKRTYTCKYICHRVTNNGYESDLDLKFTGEVARHDLRLFVEDLSDAARVPASAVGDRVLTVDELARQLYVSTKTISRWRQRGLVSRRFLFDGRKRLGFLQSSVDRFVALNGEQIRRGAQFSQLTDKERKQIIERARWLAQAGACPAIVTKQTAQETGRSAETVRYTLKHFDQDHPDAAIFPHNHGLPKIETKRKIYQQYCRGDSVQALAQRFCRASSQHLPHHRRDARRADHESAAGPHRQRAVCPRALAGERGRDLGTAAGNRRADEEVAVAQRFAPVFGQPCTRCPC